jgi:hypothetical protein
MLFRWRLGALAVTTLALCALGATTQPSKSGVVQTLQGQTFQGQITEDDKYVTVMMANNTGMRLDKRNVAKITYVATVDDQFNDRLSKLAAGDLQGRIDLANWASGQQRADLAVVALQEARKIDPTNQDAAIALGNAQRQVDLNNGGGAAPAGPGAVAPKPAAPAKGPAVVHRLFTDDEVNRLRQREMSADDPTIRVRFENGVVNRFLAAGGSDPASFRQLPSVQQGLQIIASGDPAMANDVRIATDPQPLLDFKTKASALIAASCASNACHGGTQAGDFGLFSGSSTAAIYTNYYILQTYTKTIGGTQYRAVDRTNPDRSLVLQFALPAGTADVSHPLVAGYRPRFRTTDDPVYRQILGWINSLSPIAPNYGIAVSPVLPPPPPPGN